MKKLISLIATFVMITTMFATVVYAAEKNIQPFYVRFVTIETGLSINGGVASCRGSAYTDVYSDDVYVTATLQKSNGGGWSTVTSWSANGGWRATASGTHTVSSGYTYRVKVDAKAYDSNGTLKESVTEYSSEQYY